MSEELAALGAPAEICDAERARAGHSDGTIALWEENEVAFGLFMATPWIEGYWGRHALDWAQAREVADWQGVLPPQGPERRQLWEDLRACEAGALKAYGEAREREIRRSTK